MTSHDPRLDILGVTRQHLVKSSRRLLILTLHGSDSCLGEQIAVRMQIDNLLQRNVRSLEQVVLKKQVYELEEDHVTVIGLHGLVTSNNGPVVDDLNWELNTLLSKVLRVVVLWRKLSSKVSHALHLCDSEVLARQSWPVDCLKDECHEQIGKDVLPILSKHIMQVALSLGILTVLQVKGSHDKIEALVATTDALNVLVHEQFCLLRPVIFEAEFGVVEPLLRISVIMLIL